MPSTIYVKRSGEKSETSEFFYKIWNLKKTWLTHWSLIHVAFGKVSLKLRLTLHVMLHINRWAMQPIHLIRFIFSRVPNWGRAEWGRRLWALGMLLIPLQLLGIVPHLSPPPWFGIQSLICTGSLNSEDKLGF